MRDGRCGLSDYGGRNTINVSRLHFGSIALILGGSWAESSLGELILSIEPVRGPEVISGTPVRLEAFLENTGPEILVRGDAVNFPCDVAVDAGGVGALSAPGISCTTDAECPTGVPCGIPTNPGSCTNIRVDNQSDYLSNSIDWLFSSTPPNDDKVPGLRPTNQFQCRFASTPSVGGSPFILPEGAKRYLGSIVYQLGSCSMGTFTVTPEGNSNPPVTGDTSAVVNQSNVYLPFTVVPATLSVLPVSLYADLVEPYDVVELGEIMYVLCGFAEPRDCPLADIAPCGGDGIIEMSDILAILRAYDGQYDCPHPCPQ